LLHERDRRREVGHDQRCVDPEHAVAELRESAVAAFIRGAATGVRGVVDLDDEAYGRCGEVDDEATG
jgi:hypothetical protein